jgi:hypothetical protein
LCQQSVFLQLLLQHLAFSMRNQGQTHPHLLQPDPQHHYPHLLLLLDLFHWKP